MTLIKGWLLVLLLTVNSAGVDGVGDEVIDDADDGVCGGDGGGGVCDVLVVAYACGGGDDNETKDIDAAAVSGDKVRSVNYDFSNDCEVKELYYFRFWLE